MNLKSKEEVWMLIKNVAETIQKDVCFKDIISSKKGKGIVVSTYITDLDIRYTEKIGFGKYELVEGKTDDVEVTLSMNSETYNKIQMGEVNPMVCVVDNKLKIDGIPFKLLRGQKINDEFKRVYSKMVQKGIIG